MLVMAINLTGIRRGDRPKHRAVDEVARLRAENEELACNLVRLTTENAQLAERNRNLSRECNEAGAAISELDATVHELRAELANAAAVSVPPMVRDTSNPADQATAPTGTDVSELRDNYYANPAAWRARPDDTVQLRTRFDGDGPVRRLGASHRTSWGRDEEGAA